MFDPGMEIILLVTKNLKLTYQWVTEHQYMGRTENRGVLFLVSRPHTNRCFVHMSPIMIIANDMDRETVLMLHFLPIKKHTNLRDESMNLSVLDIGDQVGAYLRGTMNDLLSKHEVSVIQCV